MAGYWPSSLFAFLWTSRSIKTQIIKVYIADRSQTFDIHPLLFDLLSYSVDETGFPRARVASDCYIHL